MTETVSCLRRIVDDAHSHNGYAVVEDYCPSSVRIDAFTVGRLWLAPAKQALFSVFLSRSICLRLYVRTSSYIRNF